MVYVTISVPPSVHLSVMLFSVGVFILVTCLYHVLVVCSTVPFYPQSMELGQESESQNFCY